MLGGDSANQQRNFAANRLVGKGSDKFRQRAAAKLFMQRGNFTRHAGRGITQNLCNVRQRLFDSMRCFIKNDGAIFYTQPFESTAAFATARRQKSGEKKLFIWQTRSRQSCQQCGGAWNGHNSNVVPQSQRDKAIS